MSQAVMISDEHYRGLLALAQTQGVSPDELVNRLLDDMLTIADQRAFWGPDIEARLAAIEREMEQQPRRVLTDEAFFAELAARPYHPQDLDDAKSTRGSRVAIEAITPGE